MTTTAPADATLAPHLEAIWPSDGHRLERRRVPAPWQRRDTYVLLPRSSRPKLLLPTSPAKVTSAVLAGYGSSAGARSRLRMKFLSGAARIGLARLIPGALVVRRAPGAESLLDHLAGQLGGDPVASIQLGPPRANRKPVLTWLHSDGEVAGFTKVGINELTRARIEVEASALQQLAATDLPRMQVPDIVATGRWRDASYLTLTPLITRSELEIDPAVRDSAADDLVAAFEVRTECLASSAWWVGLRQRVSELNDVDGPALGGLLADLEGVAGAHRIDFGAQHGDWTPWNLHTIDDRANVWDWERFATDAPIGLDQLHYAFHRATAIDGLSARAALAMVRDRSAELLAPSAADAPPPVLLALYLASTGERFLSDGQQAAGSRKGPLDSWLLPMLTRAVGDLAGPA